MRLFVILTTVSAVIAIPLPVRLRKRCGYDAGAVYPRGTFDSGTGTDVSLPQGESRSISWPESDKPQTTGYSNPRTGYITPLNLFDGGTPVTQPPSSNYNPNDNFCVSVH